MMFRFSFRTNKRLREEVAALRAELERKERIEKINSVINSNALPKCKSMACAGCENAVFYNDVFGWSLIGCGFKNKCADYKPVSPDRETAALLIQQGLTTQQMS